MTRTQIIAQARIKTENKAPDVLDMNQVFAEVCQDFCAEARFHWRRVSFYFNTAQSVSTYDLSANLPTVPDMRTVEIEEVEKAVRVDNSTTFAELVPVLDPEAIAEIMESTATGPPSGYFQVPGQNNVWQFDVIPDGVHKIRVTGWAIPTPASDIASDAVPLIPVRYHRGIQAGIEAEIWRTVYGPEDPKFVSATKKYERILNQAQAHPSFTTNRTEQWIVADPDGNQVDVIRSTS